MSLEVSYSEARNNLASLMDQVSDDLEVVVIKRRGRASVAMIDADELTSILETSHILSSLKNVARIDAAMGDIAKGKGETTSAEKLRGEFGINSRPKR
jgi:antitoxin YefM